MPSFQFATVPIVSPKANYESGQKLVFQVQITGANLTSSTVHISCPELTPNPLIATFPASKSAGTRTVKVTGNITAAPGTYTATLMGPLGGTLAPTGITATFTVVATASVQFATPFFDKEVLPPYEAGDAVTIAIEVTGKNAQAASVEVHCDAFVRNPTIISIPAAGRLTGAKPRVIKAVAPVLLKGTPGIYKVELREPANAALGTTVSVDLDLQSPVVVTFPTPAFQAGVTDLLPEAKVKLQLQLDRSPKKDIEVVVECPGFTKKQSPLRVKIKKGTAFATPILTDVTLAKEEADYQAEISFPRDYVIGDPGAFDFTIGPKRVKAWISDQPFGPLVNPLAKDQSQNIQIHFSETLEKDITLTVKCATFEPNTATFKVPKGSTSPFTTVKQFKLIGEPGLHRIELEATEFNVAKNPVDIRDGGGAASFKIPFPPGIPDLEFAKPTAFAQPLNGAPAFAPGETVRFFLQFNREISAPRSTPPKPTDLPIIALASDAFVPRGNNQTQAVAMRLQNGRQPEDPPVLEATLREDIEFNGSDTVDFEVKIAARPTEFNVLDPGNVTTIKIRNYPSAAFPLSLPVKPASQDGYDPGTQITFRLELSEPAGNNGAEAVLESALFATSTATDTGTLEVKWESGRTIAMVDARIMTSKIDVIQGGDYEVTLVGPAKRCALSTDPLRLKTSVKIRPLPTLSFRDNWIDPFPTTTVTPPPPKPGIGRSRSGNQPPPPQPQTTPTTYRVGQFVNLHFELTAPAPAIGAKFKVSSALFNEPLEGEFVGGETVLKLRVMLQKASAGGPTPITIEPVDPVYGCVLSSTPSDLTADILVLASPNVKFATVDWITPASGEYAEGTEVNITVELDAPAPEDAYARVSSTAFGGKSYIVQFPKGTQSQSAIIQTGKEDHPEKLLKPLVTTRKGRALVSGVTGGFGLDKPVKALEKSVNVLLKQGYIDRQSKAVRLQKITVAPIRGCGGTDTRDIYVRPAVQRKLNDPTSKCPFSPVPVDPPKHCNIHRLVVQQFHGGKPAKRGHDGNGSFEIVVSDAAPKLFKGAVVSPMRIQMIAGKVIYTVDDKPFHSTEIKIFADRKDYFCDDLFPHLDRKERAHPHVTVLQKKPYRLEALMAGGASVAQSMSVLPALELPEYPGWIAIDPEVPSTRALMLMKWKKVPKQEPTAPNAKLGKPLWELKLAKRRQGFDKMLTKGIAALIGKDELIFSDDDEALAEATNLGIDTSEITGGISLGMLVKSLMTIWIPRIEQYQVILESCGDPDPGKPTPKIPAGRLVAMIEVYPSDEFCFFANVSPIPGMQFGNDGQYIADSRIRDNEAANKTDLADSMPGVTNAPGQLQDALNPISSQSLGPLSGEMLTSPLTGTVSGMEQTLGGTRPGENYKNDEVSASRNNVGQLQSHGGGQVHEQPEFGGVDGEKYSQGVSQKLSLNPNLTVYTTGADRFRLIRKDPLSTPPRYPAPTPESRVFHQVYEMDLFGAGGALGDLTRDWNIAKIGLVTNGNPKPQFTPATAALFGLLYCIRHFSDVWRAIQEMVPSWGWGVTFDLGFLEGGIRLRWGWKEYEDWRVFRWWQLEINCNLFRIMVEVWVGIRARALFIKFELIAFIKITGILGVKASIERTGPSPGDVDGEFQLTDHKNDKRTASWNADLTASTTAEVGIRVVLLNDGFIKATGSIKTGYLFKFKFKEPIEGSIGLTLEGYFLGVSVKFIAQIIGLKKFIQKEKVLIEGTPDGRPHFRRILFPKGAYGQKTAWKVKDQVELIWQKVAAQVARLDEALADWYKIQLDLVLRRDKKEFAVLAKTNPRAEWPFTEDPGVSIQLTPNGYAMKTTEDDLWRQQWAICKESLRANNFTAIWDVIGDGKFRKDLVGNKYKKAPIGTIPVIGKTLHKKVTQPKDPANVAFHLIKLIDKAEPSIEMVKNAVATINLKYIKTLQKIDEELEYFADNDEKVSEEILSLIDEAKDWALWGVSSEKLDIDTRGTVRGLVEDALEDLAIEKMAKLVYQIDSWTVGGTTIQPKLFPTIDGSAVTVTPATITLWVGRKSHTIDVTGSNNLLGLRNAINGDPLEENYIDYKVIANIEKMGNSYFLTLAPKVGKLGNLAVTDGPGGEIIAGRK